MKEEIDSDMARVDEQLDALRAKLRANLHNGESNSEGLLKQSEHKYLDCLELGYQQLEELLQRDAGFWQRDLQRIKQDATKVQEQLQALLEQQKLAVQALLSGGTPAVAQPRFTLRKLPLGG